MDVDASPNSLDVLGEPKLRFGIPVSVAYKEDRLFVPEGRDDTSLRIDEKKLVLAAVVGDVGRGVESGADSGGKIDTGIGSASDFDEDGIAGMFGDAGVARTGSLLSEESPSCVSPGGKRGITDVGDSGTRSGSAAESGTEGSGSRSPRDPRSKSTAW